MRRSPAALLDCEALLERLVTEARQWTALYTSGSGMARYAACVLQQSAAYLGEMGDHVYSFWSAAEDPPPIGEEGLGYADLLPHGMASEEVPEIDDIADDVVRLFWRLEVTYYAEMAAVCRCQAAYRQCVAAVLRGALGGGGG